MKSVLHKWLRTEKSHYGIYVGPSVLACSRLVRTRGRYEAKDCMVSEAWSQRDRGEWLLGLDVGIRELLRKCRAGSGTVNVVFDDSLMRFFLVEQNGRISKKERPGIIDWHAGRNFDDADDYAWSGDGLNLSEGSVLYAEGIEKGILRELERVVTENQLLWLHAASSASLAWNHFDPRYKKGPGILIRLGREGWTLLAWREAGVPTLVKRGRWRRSHGWESEGDDLTELRRVMTAYRGGYQGGDGLALYLDADGLELDGCHSHLKSLGSAVAVKTVVPPPCAKADDLAPYAAELALATTRAYSK